ncbi:hypothetical protein JRO89_XS08G0071800 [Xanthoceras sorbifolium]|uniref:Pectinesterase inhibitor domain-containing protein n=1 Tax=Xanthoceras sorbifolium TaxID=99658 RepID=A0ABQ8HNW8_9ROSI|nr:hypothetical protein JRO89_XS08G0071800 [Xanthoceras sorbifolium]
MASPKSTAPILHYSNHQKQSRGCSTAKIIIIIMASLILLALVSLLLLFSISSASRHSKHNSSPPKTPSHTPPPPPSFPADVAEVSVACKATRYPDTCQKSLSKRVPEKPTPTQVLEAAISVSAENLETAKTMVVSIRDSSAGNKNRTNTANICLQVLDYSHYRTQSAADALPRGKVKDARAWFSAALAYQYDCWGGLKYVNGTKLVVDTMTFLDSLMGLTSNALSMMSSYENYGADFNTWKPPQTERDGFWEKVGSDGGDLSGFNGGLPSNLTEDVTVCNDGSCSHKTVQDAVNAAPSNATTRKFVIRIKEGVYEETVRVPFEKKNVVFIGDGIGKTVITGSLNVGQAGMTTYESATVGVLGDGFMASDITFKNTAGPDAHQAVAFRSDSDLSVIENCEFLGNQDTLYSKSLRQFYRKCRIQGNVDFIFGNSAAIFQDCEILVAPRQSKPEHGEQNAVTAHGRTDPAQATGFVFHNCVINGTEEYLKYYYAKPEVHRNYLGRPWKEYSRTVFVNCTMETLISPEGWLPWSGDFALKTLYYGEFGNSGAGSDTSKRVPWSSRIPADHVGVYSVKNFIQGDEWISSSS